MDKEQEDTMYGLLGFHSTMRRTMTRTWKRLAVDQTISYYGHGWTTVWLGN